MLDSLERLADRAFLQRGDLAVQVQADDNGDNNENDVQGKERQEQI